ncbi:MAG: DUF2513 domain-containing protein [Beijerinckiaceae bacterium]
MKRNMDLIRVVLLKVEERCLPEKYERFVQKDFDEFDWSEVKSHFELMDKKGFFCGIYKEITGETLGVNGLSWEGFEFLETIRDADTWSKTKKAFIAVGNASMPLVVQVATAYAKQKLKDNFGIELK